MAEPARKPDYEYPTEPAPHREMSRAEQHRHERLRLVNKFKSIVWLILGFIETFIGLRVLLKGLAANPANEFADFVYTVSRLFLTPFFGLVGEPVANGNVLEVSSLVAMVVYLLAALGINRAVEVLLLPAEEE